MSTGRSTGPANSPGYSSVNVLPVPDSPIFHFHGFSFLGDYGLAMLVRDPLAAARQTLPGIHRFRITGPRFQKFSIFTVFLSFGITDSLCSSVIPLAAARQNPAGPACRRGGFLFAPASYEHRALNGAGAKKKRLTGVSLRPGFAEEEGFEPPDRR